MRRKRRHWAGKGWATGGANSWGEKAGYQPRAIPLPMAMAEPTGEDFAGEFLERREAGSRVRRRHAPADRRWPTTHTLPPDRGPVAENAIRAMEGD